MPETEKKRTADDLEGLGRIAEKHWRKHRPKLVAQLEAEGTLYDHLYEAQQSAAEMYGQLSQEGQPDAVADELAMKEFIFLPDVQDE